jgi:flagellar assembly protein FliH
MGLIKAEKVPVEASPFSMQSIETAARLKILRAQMQAERILAEAQTAAEAIKKQAHAQALAEGRRDGLVKGLEEGRAQGREESLGEQREALAGLVAALLDATGHLDASRIALEAEAKQAVVKLAISIAERVTKRQGALDDQVALANIDEALRLVIRTTDVRVAVHPLHKATLDDVLPRIQAQWPNLKHVELVADGTLLPGGCRVYTGGGEIDGDIELQIDRIAAELVPTRRWEGEPPGEPRSRGSEDGSAGASPARPGRIEP